MTVPRRPPPIPAPSAAALLLALLAMPGPALAYIDPGSGSFLLQMLLAALAGTAFYGRQIVARIRRFFRRIAGRKDE